MNSHAITTDEDLPRVGSAVEVNGDQTTPEVEDLPRETQTTIRQGSDHSYRRGPSRVISAVEVNEDQTRPAVEDQPSLRTLPANGEERFCALKCAATALADTTLAEAIILARVRSPVFAFSLSRVGRAHPEPVVPPTFRAQPGNP